MPNRLLTVSLTVIAICEITGAVHGQSRPVWEPATAVPAGRSATIHYGSAQMRSLPAADQMATRSSWANPPSAWGGQPSHHATQYHATQYQGTQYQGTQQQLMGQQLMSPQTTSQQFPSARQAARPGLQWPQAFANSGPSQSGQYSGRTNDVPYGQSVAGQTPQQFGMQQLSSQQLGVQNHAAGTADSAAGNRDLSSWQQVSDTEAARLDRVAADRAAQNGQRQTAQPERPDPREAAFWNGLYGYHRSDFNQSQSNYWSGQPNRFNQSAAGLSAPGGQYTGFTNWSGSMHNPSLFNQSQSNYSLHNVANPPTGYWR